MSKSNKLEAVFMGGEYDGKTAWLDKPHSELTQFVEWRTSTGEILRAEKAEYKLISNGPPLKYELSKPI